MFNQRKTPPPPPPPIGGVIRLPTLERVPGEADVSSMLSHAQSARGKQVKLAWTDDSQQSVPLLTCTWDSTASEPRWVMQYGEGSMGKIVWMYDSTDIGLIINFVLGTCTGTVQEVQMNDSFAMDPVLLSADGTAGAAPASGQRVNATMEGDLVDFSVPSLLQSFGIAAMSGMLSLKGPDGSADVFFQDGNPTHAQALGSFGELALLELFTWEQGKFHFYKGERTDERTINRRLDSIIMEGVTLLDQAKFIRNAGVTPESYLIKKAYGVSEAEFDAQVSRGAAIELAVQKRFFAEIDDRTKLFEILLRLQLPKTKWLPTLYNLLSCGLIGHSMNAAVSRKPLTLADTQDFDTSVVSLSDPIKKQLIRGETGIFTYPAFVFLVEQECLRFEGTQEPFSIMVIAVRINEGNKLIPPPVEATQSAVALISSTKRRMDSLAHFQTLDFALLLPHCDASFTLLMAQRTYKLLMQGAAGLDPSKVHVTIGIASVPEHTGPSVDIIGRAREAQALATAGSPLLVASRRETPRPV